MIELTKNELAEMMKRAYENVRDKKEEINKINVFPVPDQDTGTNLAATLSGINAAIEGKEFGGIRDLSEAVLNGAMASAQGNAGVIFTGFLAGFFPVLENESIDAKNFTMAFEKGARRAHDSIQNPREGTILDVIAGAAESLKKEAEQEADITEILAKAAKAAKAALLATREKMEVLKKANVVDAGGLGFLIILESFLEAVGRETEREPFAGPSASDEVKKDIQLIGYRYEVAGLLEERENKAGFNETAIKEILKGMGDFIDVVKVENKMRIHVHTNRPKEVEKTIRNFGKALTLHVQDMAKEVAGEESIMLSAVGLVTEDIADLNAKIIERYLILIARTSINWSEEENLPGNNLYQKMREAEIRKIKSFPKTSQASPEQYFDAFKSQLKVFKKVLCITISAKLSGSYNSAKVAAELAGGEEKITIFDSRHVSVAQGLVVLRAVELIREGRSVEEIVKELDLAVEKIKMYVFFDDPKWIEAGGRLSKSKASWIRRLKRLGLHPLITVKNGALAQDGIVLARNKAEALFKKVAKDSEKERKAGKKIRTVIAHADDEESAKLLKSMLKEKIGAEVSYITMVSPTLGVHAGPGSLIVAWSAIF
jgi:hypothetical protein